MASGFKSVTFPEPATLFDNYEGRGKAEKMQDMTIAAHGQTSLWNEH
ncbi:MAG TPA: hypothetical protein VK155_12370 [Bacteroidales bacterium]|nr:hypothetical protein [Bacteroidales bacterium]